MRRFRWRTFVGAHPDWQGLDERSPDALVDEIVAALDDEPSAGLGEVGLDRRPGRPALASQRAVLDGALRAARERERPVIVHSVRAAGATLDALELVAPADRRRPWAVVHGFLGSLELARAYQQRGVAVSVGPPAFSGPRRKVSAVVDQHDLGWLLVESDTPAHRGHAGPTPAEGPGPAGVRARATEIAHRRGLAKKTVEDALAEAAADLCRGLPGPTFPRRKA